MSAPDSPLTRLKAAHELDFETAGGILGVTVRKADLAALLGVAEAARRLRPFKAKALASQYIVCVNEGDWVRFAAALAVLDGEEVSAAEVNKAAGTDAPAVAEPIASGCSAALTSLPGATPETAEP